MSTRAAIIITDGVIVDGVTLRNRDSIIEDLDGVVEHLWLETSEQLLADLRRVCDLARVGNEKLWADAWHPHRDQFQTEDTLAIDRVRAALEEGGRG